ncbi:lytic transglycosylase domain-containing protein [Frankia sp. AgPm24]|uniref:lytic transglycosylase domain-containing protein n=1 Tax=Frankia sp. AgPm24 TaxID=631128 RepID=UPI00200D94BE|nr:lytic murein transglycosylase [Frankia sp. AgPm24]
MATAAPATIAHPPARDYDNDVPPLIAAHPPNTDAAPTPAGQAEQPVAGAPETTGSTGPGATEPGSSASTVTLTATERRIPTRVLAAYHAAEQRAATAWPGCHLRWQLLAGIGRVESGHGVGRAIRADGTITSPILGPALDGQNGRALIRDTDSGRLDGDRRFDRAVGPMQFIPTTWAWAGRDGSGDGHADPHNVDDAALAAAGYLCGHHHDLAEPAVHAGRDPHLQPVGQLCARRSRLERRLHRPRRAARPDRHRTGRPDDQLPRRPRAARTHAVAHTGTGERSGPGHLRGRLGDRGITCDDRRRGASCIRRIADPRADRGPVAAPHTVPCPLHPRTAHGHPFPRADQRSGCHHVPSRPVEGRQPHGLARRCAARRSPHSPERLGISPRADLHPLTPSRPSSARH